MSPPTKSTVFNLFSFLQTVFDEKKQSVNEWFLSFGMGDLLHNVSRPRSDGFWRP